MVASARSAEGGADAHNADIAAAAGRIEGDAAAIAPVERYDWRRSAPWGGERRCNGDGGGMPPTCARASRSMPMPPASPAEALRLSGDMGVAGTRHCGFSDLVAESGAVLGLPAPAAAAAAAAWCGCVALPPTMMRPPWGPTANPSGRSPRHVQCSSGTFTTRQSSAFALASMISTWQMSGHRPNASRLNLITVNRY